MRTLVMMMMFSACDVLLEDDCDQYVDYLCTCGVADCESLRQSFGGSDPAVQEQCRIEHTCFESADGQAAETCSIVGTDEESTCLSN